MRLLRPMVVIDEGHHAYSDNALRTIDGFNPSFMLEQSATPRAASAKGAGSNILVDVRGTDLDEAEMIKLPIHVDVKGWTDWQSCLGAAVDRLDGLQREAELLRAQTARYLRPILLVQVQRTGAELRDAGYIHAEDAKAHLLQLGFTERQIAIKASLENEGMGDLAVCVSDGSDPDDGTRTITQRRRPGLERLRIYLPRVTWV